MLFVLAWLCYGGVGTAAGNRLDAKHMYGSTLQDDVVVTRCIIALLQVRAQIERAQALAAKLSDQTTVSCAPTARQWCSALPRHPLLTTCMTLLYVPDEQHIQRIQTGRRDSSLASAQSRTHVTFCPANRSCSWPAASARWCRRWRAAQRRRRRRNQQHQPRRSTH